MITSYSTYYIQLLRELKFKQKKVQIITMKTNSLSSPQLLYQAKQVPQANFIKN